MSTHGNRLIMTGAALLLVLRLFVFVRHAHGHERVAAAPLGPFPTVRTAELTAQLQLPRGKAVPPPGTSCETPWTGPAIAGRGIVTVEPENCFESVNRLLTGDPADFAHRQWELQVLQDPDNPGEWNAFQAGMRPGDVVEFVAITTDKLHGQRISNVHAQLCAGPGGLTVGANNEPRFNLVDGIPTFTHTWGICTSRQYYLALRSTIPVWQTLGFARSYRVLLYKNPNPMRIAPASGRRSLAGGRTGIVSGRHMSVSRSNSDDDGSGANSPWIRSRMWDAGGSGFIRRRGGTWTGGGSGAAGGY
jgi:hypothetical protein